jgi:hypothetical protein
LGTFGKPAFLASCRRALLSNRGRHRCFPLHPRSGRAEFRKARPETAADPGVFSP